MMERIFHTWDKWECYPAGFYEERAPKGIADDEAVSAYADFLRDLPRFEAALDRILAEWPNSCEHYLSNERMNRIAWLGQAAMCIATGIPSRYRTGYHLLSKDEKVRADEAALGALNRWLAIRGEGPLTLEESASKTQPNLY